MVSNDLTILIQGRCEKEQIQLWIENYSDWNVIISTWNDFNLDVQLPNNWKLIKSEYPIIFFDLQNLEKQLISTINGLNEVTTKYVIKVRGDEYYSNMHLVYNRIKVNSEKVLCSSVFFRPFWLYPFHISDHIISSTTENVKLMFESCYKMLTNVRKYNNSPEVHLGFSYIAAKENWNLFDLHNYIDSSEEFIKKWYDIIDINELQPYIATESTPTGRIYYRNNYGDGSHNISKL